MNNDQIKGRVKETEGKAKQVVGHVTGDRKLEEKGRMQKDVGKEQAVHGDVKHDLKKVFGSGKH